VDLPERYRDIGQPVIIGAVPGHICCVGVPTGDQTFFSTHGSGRTMSRTKARKTWRGETAKGNAERASILQYLLFRSSGGSRGAYNVDEVIEAAEMAGISQRVARLTTDRQH